MGEDEDGLGRLGHGRSGRRGDGAHGLDRMAATLASLMDPRVKSRDIVTADRTTGVKRSPPTLLKNISPLNSRNRSPKPVGGLYVALGLELRYFFVLLYR